MLHYITTDRASATHTWFLC